MLTRRLIYLSVVGLIYLAACGTKINLPNGDNVVPVSTRDMVEDLSEQEGGQGANIAPAQGASSTSQGLDHDFNQEFSQGECDERGPLSLSAAPAIPEELSYIFPMGLMYGAHVTPVDHQYYYWDDVDAALQDYKVYSPADGYAVQVGYMDIDYRLILEFSCELYSIFIHLEQLAGPLADLDGKVPNGTTQYMRIPIKAGDLIAYDGGTFGFDFSLHDEQITLPGFLVPESYRIEPWKVHTVDPYDYFEEPIRNALLTKNLRQVEPLGGKIDHDIQGRMVGNWFVVGTNGYAGSSEVGGLVKPDQQIGYWNTHLSIAFDPIDPNGVIVSIGLYDGRSAQFLVKDADPRPEETAVETGLVKYELIDWNYMHSSSGEPWGGLAREMATDIIVAPGVGVQGVVLLQMVADENLKMEAFPGMFAADVDGFTQAARLYER